MVRDQQLALLLRKYEDAYGFMAMVKDVGTVMRESGFRHGKAVQVWVGTIEEEIAELHQ